MSRQGIFVATSAVAITALIGATFWMTVRGGEEDLFADCRTGAVAGGAEIGGPFTLTSETGENVTDADVIDRPTLVYFGYTFCPDVCPMDNARNAEAQALLQERGYDVRTVFISVDPDRDTPEVLAEFTDYMHEDMIGLTGTPEQVKAAAQVYRAYFKKQDGDPEYYLVDHTTFTYLMFPEIGFAEFFRRDMEADAMADAVACFVDAAS